MKKTKQMFQPESNIQETQALLIEPMQDKIGANSAHVPSQQKSLLRIEKTILWSYRNGKEDRTLRRSVFFLKLPQMLQDKQEFERYVRETLFRQEMDRVK